MPKQLSLLRGRLSPVYSVDGVRIRESKRAKRLILQVVPPHDIELVVPDRTSHVDVQAFMQANEGWIARARAEIDRRYPPELRGLPESIDLKSVGRNLSVTYVEPTGFRPRLDVAVDGLTIYASRDNPSVARLLLRRWLMDLARRELKPKLKELSLATGLAFRRSQVRTQRTRWGSCSSTGTISLNACLLFLEPSLVRYLMIHELCHLRHLDHSRRYWSLVEQHCPDFKQADRRLGEGWTVVPAWAFAQ